MRRARLSAIDLLLPVNRSSTKSYGRLSVYDYLMSRPASSQDDTRPFLRAPLWGDLLDRAIAQILAMPTSAGTSRMALVESAAEATDQAAVRWDSCLERGVTGGSAPWRWARGMPPGAWDAAGH